jgi:hypothetical protein
VSNLLPWHPRRLNDEILSSWMLRIAAGNGRSVRSLCAWLGNGDQIWTLDSMAHSNPLINSIAAAVRVEKQTVIECLRPSLYELFGRPISQTGGDFEIFWIVAPVGTPSDRHRVSQFCPICLRQFGHRQLSWTIGVYSCCVQYKRFLQQRCPHCGKLFRAASRLFRSDTISALWGTNSDLWCKPLWVYPYA